MAKAPALGSPAIIARATAFELECAEEAFEGPLPQAQRTERNRMEIRCIHCSRPLQIEPSQLGQAVVCPHCRGTLSLPSASPAAEAAPPGGHPRAWVENTVSTLASVVFHAALLLVFALITYGETGIPNEGEEVSIGVLPEVILEEDEPELSAEAAAEPEPDSELSMSLELEAPEALSSDGPSSLDTLELSPSAAGAGGGEFELGMVGVGGSMAGGGSWEGMLQNLRRNGLDIVIAFDSTSSMSGEIGQVKVQIERIGKTLLKLVPKARVSLCTYRDVRDTYVVRGIPLTGDVEQMRAFLYGVSAGGGGDTPEAVDRGLQWAMTNNDFRTRARKVILVFGDAPPHMENLDQCLRLASDFNRLHGGVVSTVTCRRGLPLDEFRRIAEAGQGEAFLTTDERQIVTQLVVLVFGARHRSKVLEAFDLLEN